MISLIYIEYVLLIQLHSPHTIGRKQFLFGKSFLIIINRAPTRKFMYALYISFQFSVNYISCLPVNKTNICTN